MIPAEKLLGRGIIPTRIQILQQGRRGKLTGAEVEGKVHQRIQLTLGERHFDQPLHRLLGLVNIPLQDQLRLGFGDALRVALRMNQAMP